MVNLQFIGFPNYDVTTCGKVWSRCSNKFLKGSISPNHHDKYEKVMLCNNGFKRFITVHRLVALCYLDKNPHKKYVNHIDGNIYNNHLSNLEWVTALENNLHSMNNVRKPQFIDTDIKLPQRGNYSERGRGRTSITEDEAVKYCEYMMLGYRGCDLRIMMGISPTLFTIFKNKREHKYKYIADNYDFSHLRSSRPTTEDEVISVCKMLQDGNTIMSIYKKLGLPRIVVRKIAYRKTYTHISKDYTW